MIISNLNHLQVVNQETEIIGGGKYTDGYDPGAVVAVAASNSDGVTTTNKTLVLVTTVVTDVMDLGVMKGAASQALAVAVIA